MTRKQIDTSRETRLWVGTILTGITIVHGILYSTSDAYKDFITQKTNKIVSKIANKFEKH